MYGPVLYVCMYVGPAGMMISYFIVIEFSSISDFRFSIFIQVDFQIIGPVIQVLIQAAMLRLCRLN